MKKISILLVGLLTCFTSCSNSNKENTRVKTVKIDTIRTEGTQTLLQYPGKVKAAEDISIAFRVSGTIRRIYVQDGQSVKAGQLLAELDPTDYQIQLDATEAQYKQVKSEAERVIALYNDGGTTPVAYDKAVYGLKQITALYEHHKDELAYTRLYAPFDGYIQKHLFKAHETVGAGMPVLQMVGSGNPEVEINLPASEYIRRELFDNYQCTFDIYPGKVYPLTLIGITHKANSNQLYSMRLQLNAAGQPSPSAGMNTMVYIRLSDEENNELKVPTSAVFQKDGHSCIYVYHSDTGIVQSEKVNLIRLTTDGYSIIKSSSLKVGDVIVSVGVHSIQNGERVNPLPPVSETNVGGLM
ncbi:MAG: efflux RND transporter periplasmic adaptor subunit, partial [Parabacteroides sp.]|nr:efflux RND transporter periplasmic adaptor subunit [Parabacteroides sp.]